MVFLVGTTDYSAHVIAGTYAVNNEPQFSKWEDTGHRKHRFKQRDKVVGSFDMFFRTLTEYETFKNSLDSNKLSANDAVNISVTVNNTSEQKAIEAFVDYDLVRDRDGAWNDYYKVFTVTIEER